MEKQIDDFINKSYAASKVKLSAKVILSRTQLSAKELIDIFNISRFE